MVRVLAGGIAAFALAYAGFAATDASISLLAAAFALAGVGIACVETAEHAAVATLAPDGVRGSAFGVLAAVQSFGNVVASAVVGLLYPVASPSAAFTYALRPCSRRFSHCCADQSGAIERGCAQSRAHSTAAPIRQSPSTRVNADVLGGPLASRTRS